jgi:hypothetical protein
VGAIDVRFGQVQLAALSQIMSEAEQRAVKHAILDPLLKPPVTRLVGRIASRHIGPGRSGSQDPENAVDHVAWIAPRAAAFFARRLHLFGREILRDRVPLIVGEVHRNRRSENVSAVDRCRKPIESRELTNARL